MNSQMELIAPPETSKYRWLNSPVKHFSGTLLEIRAHIPEFERRTFQLPATSESIVGQNTRLDMIVRRPFDNDKTFVPVGTVSKDYALVPQTAVLDAASKALTEAGSSAKETRAALEITEYGERMRLSLFLPEKFSFDPGDGHPIAMRLECMNSVDGSTRFRALVGWFRLVCSNGLVIGITQSDLRRRHVGDLSPADVGMVLNSGISRADKEKKNFSQWRGLAVKPAAFDFWVNNHVRNIWGFKAATRTYHIAHTGCDVKIVGQYQGNTPTTIETVTLDPVPGAPEQSLNWFDVSQVLAWLAKERRDVQEQLDWREQIPALLHKMRN